MSIRGRTCIVGAFEHPARKAPDVSVAQLHAEVARGALEDVERSGGQRQTGCAGHGP